MPTTWPACWPTSSTSAPSHGHPCRPAPPVRSGSPERERIADAAWTFDTDRQRTVMMIVEAQSARQRHLAVRLLRYVVDRLLELCEDRSRYDPAGGLPPVVVAVLYTGPDRWRMPSLQELFSPVAQALMRFEFPLRYYDIHHMDRREDPDQPLLRLAFDIERAGDPGETVPVAQAIRALEDADAYALMTRFLSDEMQQWVNLRDARGRPGRPPSAQGGGEGNGNHSGTL
ncbi:MAG: Rpn family recombination-promoting nuclease/putative transposase [Caldilineaceae bacterium]|nr:Rpn family recombination-promoting nuclease/putative transposase [Caldilineaceae bacterium]